MASFMPVSWALMASLILFVLKLSAALTDCSCSLNARFSMLSVSLACAFDFYYKSVASFKRLLINRSLQSDVAPPVRVVQPQPVVDQSLPPVDARPVGAVKVRLEPLPVQ